MIIGIKTAYTFVQKPIANRIRVRLHVYKEH